MKNIRRETTGLKDWLDANSIWIRVFFFLVAIYGFILNVAEWLPKDIYSDGLNYWAYTDWLIDYSAGFIRRGLSGEIVAYVASCCDSYTFVAWLSWGIFLVFASAYFFLCFCSIRTLGSLEFAAVLFLPSLVPFYLFDHGAFGRKEIVGFIFLILHLVFVE